MCAKAAEWGADRGGLGDISGMGREISRDLAVATVAARQHGNVTRAQLLSVGLNDDAIAHRVRTGRLYRVHAGVYAVGRPARMPLERAAAAVMACGPGAALSHSSAMTLWGFWRRWDEPLELTVTGDRRPPKLTVHRTRTLHRRDVRTHQGIRATSPGRALIDTEPRQSDAQLKRAVNTALNSPWLTEDQLAETLARHPLGSKRISRLTGLEGTPTRSGWEDDFPAFCARYALPQPVMGARVLGYTVDALFPNEKVIVELDSWEFHKSPIAFETDRERDADTLALGLATVRITWTRLTDTEREAARLHQILSARRRDSRATPAAPEARHRARSPRAR